jgi:hypothetical protein
VRLGGEHFIVGILLIVNHSCWGHGPEVVLEVVQVFSFGNEPVECDVMLQIMHTSMSPGLLAVLIYVFPPGLIVVSRAEEIDRGELGLKRKELGV